MDQEKKRQLRIAKPEITMAPLVDIVFLLLIFFMVTTVFPEKVIPIDKPESSNNITMKEEHIPVTIDRHGTIFIKQQAVDFQQLELRLKDEIRHQPHSVLVVFADKQATTELLIQVIDTARTAGVEKFGIATDDANS